MNTKRHRHFVAVPLAAFLMLAVAGMETVLKVGAEGLVGASTVRFEAGSTATDFQTGWHFSGTLQPGSIVSADKSGEHTELLHGHATLRSTGFTEVTAGNVRIAALAASFTVLHDESSTTVAPLTAPVIVSYGADTKVLVPGMQLTVTMSGKATVATVPVDWYMQELQAIKLLSDAVIPSSSQGTSRADTQADLARLLSRGRITTDVFADMDAAAFSLDATGMTSRLLLLRLLQENARTDTDASQAIASAMSEDRFLVTELQALLPLQITTLQKPVAEAHIRLWEKTALSRGLTDAASAVSLLRENADFPERLRRAGYPEQSILWQHALSYVGTTLRTTLTGDALTSMDNALSVINRADIEEEVYAAPVAAPYVPVTHWSESELIALVSHTLTSKGVLMAVTTELAPDTPTQTVRVSGVFIAEQGSDVPYVFTFDVARSLITDIKRNGKELPNTVPVDVFFR